MLNATAVSVLVAVFMLSSPALAATWYVNGVSGDDGNSCKTATTACPTIGHAISLTSSGDKGFSQTGLLIQRPEK